MNALPLLAALSLSVIAALLGAALAALVVPFRFALRASLSDDGVDGLAEVMWGFGAVRACATPDGVASVRLFGRTVYRFTPRTAPKRASTEPSDVSSRAAWRPPWRVAWRVLRRVLRSLRLRARVSGRLGTGDPAETARLHGLLVASRELLRGVDTRALRVDWMDAVIDLEGRVEGRVWLAAIAWIVASELARSRWVHPTQEAP